MEMETGRILIVVGAALVALGGMLLILPKGINPTQWFGRLPGDIHYSSDRTEVYIPLVSMVILSILLSVVSWLVQRLLK